jgi:hypothetical protein
MPLRQGLNSRMRLAILAHVENGAEQQYAGLLAVMG